MARSQQTKMPVVQRRQLPLTQSLNNAQHRRINEADARIRVLLTDVSGTRVVFGQQILDGIGA